MKIITIKGRLNADFFTSRLLYRFSRRRLDGIEWNFDSEYKINAALPLCFYFLQNVEKKLEVTYHRNPKLRNVCLQHFYDATGKIQSTVAKIGRPGTLWQVNEDISCSHGRKNWYTQHNNFYFNETHLAWQMMKFSSGTSERWQ